MRALLVVFVILASHVAFAQSDIKWIRTSHYGGISSVSFTPDGRYLASTGSFSDNIFLWDGQMGRFIRRMSLDHSTRIHCARFLPNSTVLATGTDSGIYFVDIESGSITDRIAGDSAMHVSVLEVSSTGDTILYVAMVADDPYDSQRIIRLDRKTHVLIDSIGVQEDLLRPAYSEYFTPLRAISEDLRYVMTIAFNEHTIYDLRTATVIKLDDEEFDRFSDSVSIVWKHDRVFSETSDATRFAYGDQVIDPDVAQPTAGNVMFVRDNDTVMLTGIAAAFDLFGSIVRTGGRAGGTTFEVETGKVLSTRFNNWGFGGYFGMSYSKNGKLAYVSLGDYSNGDTHYLVAGDKSWPNHLAPKYCVNTPKWDPLEDRIAFGLRMISMDEPRDHLPFPCPSITAEWHPSGSHYIWSAYGDSLAFEDRSGLRRFIRSGHGIIYDIAVSPNGAYIATSGRDSLVRIWNIDGEQIQTFEANTGAIGSMSFAPNSRQFVGSCSDTTIRVWDIEQGEIYRYSEFREAAASQVQISYDGSTVMAVASRYIIAYDAMEWADVKPPIVKASHAITAQRIGSELRIEHDFDYAGQYTVEIYDILGRLLLSRSIEQGGSDVIVDISSIARQPLLVRVIVAGESASALVP